MLAKNIVIGKRNQITLPKKFIQKGTDSFCIQKRSDGTIELIPLTSIPTSQLYFWSKRWQAGERKASEDIVASRLHSYDSTEELFKDIGKRRKK